MKFFLPKKGGEKPKTNRKRRTDGHPVPVT